MSEEMKQQQHSSSSKPKFAFDDSFLKTQMETMAQLPSIFFTMLTAKKPGLAIDEALCVSLNMPGIKKEDVNAIVSQDKHLFVRCETGGQVFMAGLMLPENFDRKRALTSDLEDGALKLTLPLLTTATTVSKKPIETFFDSTNCTTFYAAMMDRSIQQGDIRVAMAHLRAKLKSFTLYQKESLESVYIQGSTPGLEKMEVTADAVCVSLHMPGFKIEDVECRFVEYNTLMIQGKKNNERYMAGVRTPEGFHGEDRMIKKEMEDGMYKVTLPRVDVVSEEAKRMTGALFYKVRRY